MSYKLFLDDVRQPKQVKWIQIPLGPWVIVRDYKEFVATLNAQGCPSHVSFDHDLADEHYASESWNWAGHSSYRERTGYDCAEFLVEHCRTNGLDIPPYTVHSMNPVGRENIKRLLQSSQDKLKNERSKGTVLLG